MFVENWDDIMQNKHTILTGDKALLLYLFLFLHAFWTEIIIIWNCPQILWYSSDWNSPASIHLFTLKGFSPWSETCQCGATNLFGNLTYQKHNTYLKRAAVHLPANLSWYCAFLETYVSLANILLMGFHKSIRGIYFFLSGTTKLSL